MLTKFLKLLSLLVVILSTINSLDLLSVILADDSLSKRCGRLHTFIDGIYAFELTDRLLSLVLFIRVLDAS